MDNFSLSDESQITLLKTARNSIEYSIKSMQLPETRTENQELNNLGAVFVTLTKNGSLRGCIGTTAPQAPLIKAVSQMAAAAALEDYRFGPVTSKELSEIKIEISVLSPMTKVKTAADIKEIVHGVVVKRGARSGIFLPQVWEHFSSKEDFLNELCSQKAGLEPNAWKDPKTELYIFTVFAFEEK